MSKEEIVKEVITILDTSSYIDPSEHLYDGLKQIKREITYATVHDFLWALESSTVIDVDGRVTECANKIKPLLADMIIDEVYEAYKTIHKHDIRTEGDRNQLAIESLEKQLIYPQEEFINKCKKDPVFSETWGLKIEERELRPRQRTEVAQRMGIILSEGIKSSKEWDKECDENNVPTKLITLTYNNAKIESYEN